MARIADPRYEAPALLLPHRHAADGRMAVDWGHHLARGLVFFAAGSGWDVVTQEPPHPRASATKFPANEFGKQVESTSDTTGGAFWNNRLLHTAITDEWTWVIRNKITSMASFAWMTSMNAQSTWVGPYAFGFGRQSTASAAIIFYPYDNTNYTELVSGTGMIAADSAYHFRAATKPSDGSATPANCKFYLDGVLHSSGTGGTGAGNGESVWFNTAKYPVIVCTRHTTSNGEGWTGFVDYVGLWSRVLSAEEIYSLYLDPYQALIPI